MTKQILKVLSDYYIIREGKIMNIILHVLVSIYNK